ncbi:hypothetical protein CAL7716_100320 (plasmid) [Calothrix sp. PCC 7716]|nr:hypothetical protein CAL7716_100320 [Calothrix sp. PCC 7716]
MELEMEESARKEFRLLLTEVLGMAPINLAKTILIDVQAAFKNYGTAATRSQIDTLNYYKERIEESAIAAGLPKLPTQVVKALDEAAKVLHDETLPHHELNVPFMAHVYYVVGVLLESHVTDENFLSAAALFHAVEKGILTLDDIKSSFSKETRRLVESLTSVSELERNTPKWQRFEMLLAKAHSAPDDIKDTVNFVWAAETIAMGSYFYAAELEGNHKLDPDGEVRSFYSKLIPIILESLKHGLINSQLRTLRQKLFWR